jgi:hypothetical protein
MKVRDRAPVKVYGLWEWIFNLNRPRAPLSAGEILVRFCLTMTLHSTPLVGARKNN